MDMDAVDRSQLELLRVEMAGKLDRLTDEVKHLSDDLRDFTQDHEKRVRALERWKFAIPASGILVIAAFLGGKVG
jgi:hypothetical protein